jgi:penicillin-binding protein 2
MENRAIKGLYPPGSTYKIVMAAAGLEKGVITENTTYNCPGYFQLGNRNYRCWKKGGHGQVSIHRALVQSCDVFFYQVGYHLGIDTIAQYAMGFGLGAITGFDQANEKIGLVPTQAWKLRVKKEPWQPGETISASIGQGFNIVTPMQLANLIAAVGNGGTLYKPHIIKSIQKPNGEIVQEIKPEIIGHLPVSQGTLKIIREGLLGVVKEQGGTGSRARVQGVDLAGKTGTAQVVRMKEGWDETSKEEIPFKYRDHALFIAFAPYEKPLLGMSIIVEHGGHGGSASAPIAQKIIQSLLLMEPFKLKMDY